MSIAGLANELQEINIEITRKLTVITNVAVNIPKLIVLPKKNELVLTF